MTNTTAQAQNESQTETPAPAEVTVAIGAWDRPSCLCGCGASRDETGARFVPGHDATTKGMLLRATRSGATLRVTTDDEPEGRTVTPDAYARAAFSDKGYASWRVAADKPQTAGRTRRVAQERDRTFAPSELTGQPATTRLAEKAS